MTPHESSRQSTAPSLRIERHDQRDVVIIEGDWTMRGLVSSSVHRRLRRCLKSCSTSARWILRPDSFDTAGACLLLTAWGMSAPREIDTTAEIRDLLQRCLAVNTTPRDRPPRTTIAEQWDAVIRRGFHTIVLALEIFGTFILDTCAILIGKRRPHLATLSREITDTGVRALFIVGLVSLLIGVVVSYLLSLEFRNTYATSILVYALGLIVLRELGPMVAAILVAGRSGSSITAEIGVMKIRGELDALKAMGIDQGPRLIDPKILALLVSLPLLTLWSDMFALFGGIVTASLTLKIPLPHLLPLVPRTVPISNYWLGLGKAAVFGITIGLVATTFGLAIASDSMSLGHETTRSVVTSITLVIIIDALAAIVFRNVGMP